MVLWRNMTSSFHCPIPSLVSPEFPQKYTGKLITQPSTVGRESCAPVLPPLLSLGMMDVCIEWKTSCANTPLSRHPRSTPLPNLCSRDLQHELLRPKSHAWPDELDIHIQKLSVPKEIGPKRIMRVREDGERGELGYLLHIPQEGALNYFSNM